MITGTKRYLAIWTPLARTTISRRIPAAYFFEKAFIYTANSVIDTLYCS
jgi:hypothetical protein